MKTFLKGIVVIVLISVIGYIGISVLKHYEETIFDLSESEKVADFEYLKDLLETAYPFWEEVSNAGIDKERVFDTYEARIRNTSTDLEFIKTMGQMVNEFNGIGHLGLLDGYSYEMIHQTMLTSNTRLDTDDYQQMMNWFDAVTNENSQNLYGMLDTTKGKIRTKKGLKTTADVEVVETNRDNLEMSIIEENKIAYVKINSFQWMYIEKDYDLLMNFYDDIKNYDHLIVDIRDNQGGTDKYWEQLIVEPLLQDDIEHEKYYLFKKSKDTNQKIEEQFFNQIEVFSEKRADEFTHYIVDREVFIASSENDFQGKVYVLTNEKVYSAAENFVMMCKGTNFATLVGQSTGGDGGIIDPLLISLPHSGLIVRFSVFYGLNADGTGNESRGTLPDILTSNHEDALERCLMEIQP